MRQKIFKLEHPWINFNIILFSGYVLFGIPSFFWPTPLTGIWFILLHFTTLLVDIFVIYGLIAGRFRVNYLIVVISILMVAHLVVFIFVPLGMVIAYMGPSRAFYSFFLIVTHTVGGSKLSSYALTSFNSLMIVIHLVNIFYFKRKNVAELFPM